jgi:hypothetical protein
MDLFEHGVVIQPVSKSFHTPHPLPLYLFKSKPFSNTVGLYFSGKEMLAKRPLFVGSSCLLINSRLFPYLGAVSSRKLETRHSVVTQWSPSDVQEITQCPKRPGPQGKMMKTACVHRMNVMTPNTVQSSVIRPADGLVLQRKVRA